MVHEIGPRFVRAANTGRAVDACRTIVRARPAAGPRLAGAAGAIGVIAVALGSSGVAAATPTLLGIDTPPVTVADVYTTTYEHVLVKSRPGVLANDLDADGDGLVASLRNSPDHGSLEMSDDGSFSYRPDDGFSGIDTFTYVASDGQAASLPALVTVTVGPPPPSPTPTPRPTAAPETSSGPALIVLPTLPPLPTLPALLPTPTPTATPRPTPVPSVTPTPSSPSSVSPSASTSADDASGAGTTTGAGGTTNGPAGPADRGGATTAFPSPEASGAHAGTSGSQGAAIAIDVPILGTLSIPTDWIVPGLAFGVPGMLLIIAVIAQALGAVAWLPLVRRNLRRAEDDRIPRRKRRDSLVS